MKTVIWYNPVRNSFNEMNLNTRNNLADRIFSAFVLSFVGEDHHLSLFGWELIGEL